MTMVDSRSVGSTPTTRFGEAPHLSANGRHDAGGASRTGGCQVSSAVATALGVADVRGRSAKGPLVEHLQSKHVLLVLDIANTSSTHALPSCAICCRRAPVYTSWPRHGCHSACMARSSGACHLCNCPMLTRARRSVKLPMRRLFNCSSSVRAVSILRLSSQMKMPHRSRRCVLPWLEPIRQYANERLRAAGEESIYSEWQATALLGLTRSTQLHSRSNAATDRRYSYTPTS